MRLIETLFKRANKKYYIFQNLCTQTFYLNFNNSAFTRVTFIKFWPNVNVYTIKQLHLYSSMCKSHTFLLSLIFLFFIKILSVIRNIKIYKIKYFQTCYMLKKKIAILHLLCNIN